MIARLRRLTLFMGAFALTPALIAAEPTLRVLNRMQPEAAPETKRVWQLARGASIVGHRGAALRLPGGGYANAMTVASPGGAFRVELHASLASEVSGSKAVAKLTIFLHRGRETRSLKETVRHLSSAGEDAAEHAALVWVQDDGLSEGWKLGAQILVVDGTVLAHSATLLIEPLKKPEVIEGAFGRVEVDVMRPALTRLTLRRPDGSLEPQSLLSDPQWPWFDQSGPEWANGAGTQVMDAKGRRYESRQATPESVSVIENGIALNGITLRESSGSEPVAREDWQLRAERDTLLWTIHRTWLRPLELEIDSTPGLFSSMRVLNQQFEADGKPLQAMPNATTTTLWVQPDQLEGRFHPAYRAAAQHDRRLISRHNLQWLARRDQWAIHKIFGSWENAVDLRLEPEGGHLMRRGCFGYLTEFGVTVHPRGGTSVVPGQSETVVLRLSPVDKKKTGYHLAVRLPDQELQERLTSFYASLLNGGVINDQLSFNFGNETDGWFYAGNAWIHGHAIAAGVPVPGALSSDPMDAITAFRGHLASILGTAQADGRSAFGYNRRGTTLDDNLHAVRGMLIFTLCSGDRAFARQHLPLLERMLDIYLQRRNKDGLFDLGEDGNQYYDAIRVSGISGYHNACFYKALRDMAALQRLAGSAQSAPRYDEIADEIKEAYNRLLWAEDAPGGPRYLDWITHDGKRVHYCSDISQFTPLAFGIASPEQAAKVLRTIDARIAELEKNHGYAGVSSLSAYWPAPIELMRHPSHTFPIYMNGAGFFAQTYWEVLARARCGDPEGALQRLKKFAEGTTSHNWVGNNWVTMDGKIGRGVGEPYLSDMIVVCAGLVHGLLGIRHTEQGLEASPSLPAAWKTAEAVVLHEGRAHRVSIAEGKAEIVRLDTPRYLPPAPLTWKVATRGTAAWGLSVERYFDSGIGWKTDPGMKADQGLGLRLESGPDGELAARSGHYTSHLFDWNQPVRVISLRVKARLQGGRATAVVETSDDHFSRVLQRLPVTLADGDQTVSLRAAPASQVRVHFHLEAGSGSDPSPALDGFTISGLPQTHEPR